VVITYIFSTDISDTSIPVNVDLDYKQSPFEIKQVSVVLRERGETYFPYWRVNWIKEG
jgi:hypothetical protein